MHNNKNKNTAMVTDFFRLLRASLSNVATTFDIEKRFLIL